MLTDYQGLEMSQTEWQSKLAFYILHPLVNWRQSRWVEVKRISKSTRAETVERWLRRRMKRKAKR
jgi:hypothetical protein